MYPPELRLLAMLHVRLGLRCARLGLRCALSCGLLCRKAFICWSIGAHLLWRGVLIGEIGDGASAFTSGVGDMAGFLCVSARCWARAKIFRSIAEASSRKYFCSSSGSWERTCCSSLFGRRSFLCFFFFFFFFCGGLGLSACVRLTSCFKSASCVCNETMSRWLTCIFNSCRACASSAWRVCSASSCVDRMHSTVGFGAAGAVTAFAVATFFAAGAGIVGFEAAVAVAAFGGVATFFVVAGAGIVVDEEAASLAGGLLAAGLLAGGFLVASSLLVE